MGGQADAPLRWRQAKLEAHRPRQERIDRRPLRPDSFLQAGQNQTVGAHHPRFQHAQDHQPRMGGRAGANCLGGEQAIEKFRKSGPGHFRQPSALGDQGGEQDAGRFARGAVPKLAQPAIRIGGEGLHCLGHRPGSLGRRRRLAGIGLLQAAQHLADQAYQREGPFAGVGAGLPRLLGGVVAVGPDF